MVDVKRYVELIGSQNLKFGIFIAWCRLVGNHREPDKNNKNSANLYYTPLYTMLYPIIYYSVPYYTLYNTLLYTILYSAIYYSVPIYILFCTLLYTILYSAIYYSVLCYILFCTLLYSPWVMSRGGGIWP